ncbi:DUF1611 domain-containing protein [Kordiimonas pumila]|uniref:DUF1611 domain-containing protein n=1 Tax=Kordiimonas pumila TaxID=2161677 RepID=A0ABV7D399_9PROT|nr:DUF1611 domain-containing protein [Kordiimonas pumila]
MKTIEITPPYLIFLGTETKKHLAKTGAGLVEWRPELCKGQLSLIDNGVSLGLPDMTLQQAVDAGIKTVLIGTATVGGSIPDSWLDALEEAALLGLDIVAGVHTKLGDIPRLKAAAEKSGSKLIDVRVPPAKIPVGNGKKRTGKRVLMVGTDCAVGKKYSALAMERDMKAMGMNADFRASGQTGIMIAGEGIPIDSVVSDFVSGAAELLSPDNTPDHWDVIEGQGGIFHPGFGAVTFGLLVGSQPDAFVVCLEAGRTHVAGWEDDYELPSIEDVIDRTIAIGSLTNPAIRCVGISVNTANIPEAERKAYLEEIEKRVGLPTVDPLKGGTQRIIERLKAEFPA